MTQFEIDKERIEKAMETGERTRITISLTPAMVAWLLEKNSDFNRKPSRDRIAGLELSIENKGYIQVDDLKMYEGKIINGQHRLMALRNIFSDPDDDFGRSKLYYMEYGGWPQTGIVVNISKDEAVLTDTNQPRTMGQRIYMATGVEYEAKFRQAVQWELTYGFSNHKNKSVTDEEVIERMNHEEWRCFVNAFPPSKKLCVCCQQFTIKQPIYCAIKQFFTRCNVAQWKRFLSEFEGNNTSKMVQNLRDLIVLSKGVKGGQNAIVHYRKAISYLGGFLRRIEKIPEVRKFWPYMAEYEMPPKHLWTEEMKGLVGIRKVEIDKED